MAFFSAGADKEKLMILYSLKSAGIPLSREQIASVVYDQGLDNYITLSEHLMELEENSCLATVPTYRLQTMVLTRRGEEVVSLFENTLPRSIRNGLDEFIEAHRDGFRRENTSQVQSKFHTDGSFSTELALVENGEAFFEIRIKLPSAGYTRIAERRWDELNQKLYLDTLLALTSEEPDEARTDGVAKE